MADQVEEVKSKIDIVSVISEQVELKKAGRNYKGLCPFHSEKTPSFMVSPELQIFKCFGCGESGDVFAFLEKHEGMEFGEALKALAEKVGVKLSYSSGQSPKDKFYVINDLAAKFYNFILLSHPLGKRGLTYLMQERGIKRDTIIEFSLGFAPENPNAVSSFLVGKKKIATMRDLVEAGLAVNARGRFIDRFRGRVIFPIYDQRGNAVALAGRIMPGSKVELAKYINSPETPVYHKSNVLYGLNVTRAEIKKLGYAVIVEGELDMISSWQAGIKNVVAIKGSSLTPQQVRLLARLCEKVILALDSDMAGDIAARRGIEEAFIGGLTVTVAKLGKYKDPDEFARADPEGFKNSIENAVSVWDFILDSIFKKYDARSGEGKAKISREIVPVLADIPDAIVAAHYVGLAARRLGVAEEAVSEELKRHSAQSKKDAPKLEIAAKVREKGRRDLLEERLLSLLLQHDPGRISQEEYVALLQTPLIKKIAGEAREFLRENKRFDAGEFAKILPSELSEGYGALILAETGIPSEDMEKVDKEIEQVKREIGMMELKGRLQTLSKEMSDAEKESDGEKLSRMQKEFSALTDRLKSLDEGS